MNILSSARQNGAPPVSSTGVNCRLATAVAHSCGSKTWSGHNTHEFNGHYPEHPNTLNVSFIGRVGGDILASLDGVAASTGSSCHSGKVELSPVLQAMGVAPEIGMGAIRFSLERGTTAEEIDMVVERLSRILA